MQANTQIEHYIEGLKALDFQVEAIDTHAARITLESLEFILVVAEDEPAFFQLMLPGVWQADAGTDRAQLLDVANDVMNAIKAAKVVIHGEAVHVSVEQFVAGPEQGIALVPGLLELLRSAVAEFHERMGMGPAPRVH